tara:strand:+ start:171 stop:428 length:258 start_codon:yes stop_codon:yes gene_type:complete
MNNLPQTTAYVTINKKCFKSQIITGEIKASDFFWEFVWNFNQGELAIKPPLGKALIQDALLRFLIKEDYSLEEGNNYYFKISAKL